MRLIKASWVGTALLAATALAATVANGGPLRGVAFAVAVGLFLAGCLLFVAAYARAVRRSREVVIGVAELFFLTSGVAPPEVRRALLGSFLAEVVVGLGTAIARPYSSLAAGTLAPLYGLSLCGLWAARNGAFPPRPQK